MSIDFSISPTQTDFTSFNGVDELHPDPIESLLSQMAEFDLHPGEVITDGKLHRFDIDKNKDQAGGMFSIPAISAEPVSETGKTGEKDKWCPKEVARLTWQEREKYRRMCAEAKKARLVQEKINHDNARILAKKLWMATAPVKAGGHRRYRENLFPVIHSLCTGQGKIVWPH